MYSFFVLHQVLTNSFSYLLLRSFIRPKVLFVDILIIVARVIFDVHSYRVRGVFMFK